MKKIETTIGRLCHIRKRVAQVAPELTDFGMRVATAKATILANPVGMWLDERCAIYITEAEWAIIRPIMENEVRIFPVWDQTENYYDWHTEERTTFDRRTSVRDRAMRTDNRFYSPYVRED